MGGKAGEILSQRGGGGRHLRGERKGRGKRVKRPGCEKEEGELWGKAMDAIGTLSACGERRT